MMGIQGLFRQNGCCWGLESTTGKVGIRKASSGGCNFWLRRFQLLSYRNQDILSTELARSGTEKEQRQRHTQRNTEVVAQRGKDRGPSSYWGTAGSKAAGLAPSQVEEKGRGLRRGEVGQATCPRG